MDTQTQAVTMPEAKACLWWKNSLSTCRYISICTHSELHKFELLMHHRKQVFKTKMYNGHMANLRNLIFANSIVILLKLDSNHQSPYDLEIWWIASQNNWVPLLCYVKFVQHSKAIGEFKLELLSRNAQFESKSAIFCPVWPWNLTDYLEKLKDTSTMLLHHFIAISGLKLATVRKHPIRVKIGWTWNLTDDFEKQ